MILKNNEMVKFLFFSAPLKENENSSALLLLRLFIGVLMLTHGWGKLSNFEALSGVFPDPVGLGSKLSLILAVGAEFFASIFLILGLLTRLSVIPLAFTMSVAFFVVHAADTFQVKELALLYLGIYLFIFLAGPGKYSLDAIIFKKRLE